MRRSLLATLVVALAALPAPAKRIAAPPNPVVRALQADAVVVGKVTAIEKEAVELPAFPGSPVMVAHKVAVIKIDKGLTGADNLTHIKVGFIAPADPTRPGLPRRGFGAVAPTLDMEGVFFLSKHPSGQFYAIAPLAPPVETTEENYKQTVEFVTKALACAADPTKALAAAKVEDRTFAAVVILTQYRTVKPGSEEVTTEKVSVADSRRVLNALAEGDWSKVTADAPPAVGAFYALGLTPDHKWVAPKPVVAQPGQPATNYNAQLQKAFAEWLDGPGKDYQIEKFVQKRK